MKKVQAIEEFDGYVVGEMIRFQEERNDMRILVAPDHATPVSLKTHASDRFPMQCGGHRRPVLSKDTLKRMLRARNC